MADRGAVFRLKRRVGFGEPGEGEPVVVLQATSLNSALPTTIVVPLDLATQAHDGAHTVPVSGAEVGAPGDYVALPTLLRPIRVDLLAPGAVGRLRPTTMAALVDMVAMVLDL